MPVELRRTLVLGLTSTLLSLVAAPALAVDGVVEINQARALAGGVTPGDGAGFPVTITASGSYRLTGNLTVDENTTAISVTAAAKSVTIDLNGFSLLGPVECSPGCLPASGTGDGIASSGAYIRILNGTVRGMGHDGVLVSDSLSVTIESVHALHNRLAGIFTGGQATVVDSVAQNNGYLGIRVGLDSTVRGCAANSNGSYGIYALGNALIVDNNVTNNSDVGIDVVGIGTVVGNLATGNSGIGIEISQGVVLDDTATGNGGLGLQAGTSVGYARNVFNANNGGNANPQVGGGAAAIQTGTNVCGDDASCP